MISMISSTIYSVYL